MNFRLEAFENKPGQRQLFAGSHVGWRANLIYLDKCSDFGEITGKLGGGNFGGQFSLFQRFVKLEARLGA